MSTALFARLLVVLSMLVVSAACNRTIHVYRGSSSSIQSDTVLPMIGASNVDITPGLGHLKGGWGLEGARVRGILNPLYSTATYIRGVYGRECVIVSVDLWSVSTGFSDRVCEIVRDEYGLNLFRDQIMISATHTHSGPNNYSTVPAHNYFGSIDPCLDLALFEHLAHRVALSINDAYEDREHASLYKWSAKDNGIGVNRSMAAFVSNPLASTYIELQSNVKAARHPVFVDSLATRAVDRSIDVIYVVPERDTAVVKSIMVFAAFHPNIIKSRVPLYSSDLVGSIRVHLGNGLSSANHGKRDCIVQFHNGSEGDVSTLWMSRTAFDVNRQGQEVAGRIFTGVLAREGRKLDVKLKTAYAMVPIRNQIFTLVGQEGDDAVVQTYPSPIPGISMLIGSEEGRTVASYYSPSEGMDRATDGRLTIDDVVKLIGGSNIREQVQLQQRVLQRLGKIHSLFPDLAPIQVVELDDIKLIGIPGEPTTYLGWDLEALSTHGSTADAIVVGLANGYFGYLTTEYEYSAGHYEGASSLFGPYFGRYLSSKILEIHGNLDAQRTDTVSVAYPCQLLCSETVHAPIISSCEYEYAASFMSSLVYPSYLVPVFVWPRAKCASDDGVDRCATTHVPQVSIQVKRDGVWSLASSTESFPGLSGASYTVPQDSDCGMMSSVMLSSGEVYDRWESRWVPDPSLEHDTVRWRVDDYDGDSDIVSEQFVPCDIRKMKRSSVIVMDYPDSWTP